jgi:(p)ppGpp synthase/HD superfamily hydrolase
MTVLGERYATGLAYAFRVHREDVRKGSGVPYVSHLLGVSGLVLEHGGSEDEAIGGLLHDAAEDHGGREQLAAIEREFGPEVARIVEGCSDSLEAETAPKGEWHARKEHYIAHLRELIEAGEEAIVLVSAADKLHNARSIHDDVRRTGDAIYGRFKGGKEGTLWYYRSLAEAFALRPGRHSLMGAELAEIVGLLEAA